MRTVADTNIVVSGLLWRGPPRQLLDAARQGTVELFTSGALLAELEEVLQREKFFKRLAAAQVQAHDLVTGYAALATVVQPAQIEPVVLRDPDDDGTNEPHSGVGYIPIDYGIYLGLGFGYIKK